MAFTRIEPAHLKELVDCFWIVDNDDPVPGQQKIIPDGYPEVIFHFGDPYEIQLNGPWHRQGRQLLAGQITRFFFLRNSGRSNLLGVKFKPAAITSLFGFNMHLVTDQVVPLMDALPQWKPIVVELYRDNITMSDRIDMIMQFLSGLSPSRTSHSPVECALAEILATRGKATVATLCHRANVSERQLERLFRKHVGLSPKFYARIIRFNSIFQLVQEGNTSGIDIGLESGFYDQSHFIRNFKSFTGEEPSHYFFDEPTLANFFLKGNS